MFGRLTLKLALPVALALLAATAHAAGFPDPVEGDYRIEDFRFHDGTVMAINMHYRTIGDPANPAVLVLHGTNSSGQRMLAEGFAGALYGEGQPLDAGRHFLILPDSLGAGGSSKPSDGMRAEFPEYNYDDMVDAQHRLVREGLGLDRLRLVIGQSMGGMHVWTWAVRYPGFADALVPMAALPAPMAGRNWMMRRMLVDAVRNDPAWMNGDYVEQPPALKTALVWYDLATNGGTMRLWKQAPTNAEADAFVDRKFANASAPDANDTLYQWSASRDFDPSPDLEKITAPLLAINADDDERNPPELGLLETAMTRIPSGASYVIPEGWNTRGHGTTGAQATLYAEPLREFLDRVPVRP